MVNFVLLWGVPISVARRSGATRQTSAPCLAHLQQLTGTIIFSCDDSQRFLENTLKHVIGLFQAFNLNVSSDSAEPSDLPVLNQY
jgi:hypothetical protein